MENVYTREFTFTGYTLATKDFVLSQYMKKLPKEAMTTDLEKISKLLGYDFTKVSNAEITLKDKTKIIFMYSPIDGDDHKIVQEKEFVRNWYNRDTEEYIDPQNPHIRYKNGIIEIYVIPLYNYTRLQYIRIPESFPIEDWEKFSTDPAKEIFPHIPVEYVQKVKTVNKAVFIDVNSAKKSFRTAVKRTKKYYKYSTVPFVEGIFTVKVPKNIDVDITTTMSIHDLPDDVKLKPRLKITDNPAWTPESIEYDLYYPTLYFKTRNLEITYWVTDDVLDTKIPSKGKTIFFDRPALPHLAAILETNKPIEYIISVSAIL